MIMTENQLAEMLSKSENTVYQYIKEKSELNNGSLKESMAQMGENLDVSEATVHRAIRKLRKEGIIGVVPSVEKAESNEIVYYGIPDAEKQVGDIFKMIGELSSSSNRFQAILKNKDQAIEQLQRDKERLYETIDKLERQLKDAESAKSGFDQSRILSSKKLDDGTTAYIVKTN
jgi:DNA-binding MurR/RpiR family transcriptional regulator